MAKLGEQDPRWIVSARSDVNVDNWHWCDKDLSSTMRVKLTELLKQITLTQGDTKIKITEVDKVEGEMTAMNRKGKTFFVYDFTITAKWTGETIFQNEPADGSGTVIVSDVMNDDSDYQLKITTTSEEKSNNTFRECLKKQLNKKIEECLNILVEEARVSVNVQQPVNEVKIVTEPAPVKVQSIPSLVQNSPSSTGASLSSSNNNSSVSNSKLSTKVINQTITFDVPPKEIYDFLTNENKIKVFTQGPCKFSTIDGGAFEMFGGNLIGTQVSLQPNVKIEQKWRFSSWPENHYSDLLLEFKPDGEGTKLVLTQKGVPSSDFDRTKGGWEEFFWSRIKAICGWNYKILK